MKVTFSLSFYHIPKFLKNDLIKRLEINILNGILISKLYTREAVVVEPSGIEPLTSCVQGRRSPSLAMAPYRYRVHQ